MDIERLRETCLGLSHVTEDIKWGADLCFLIGGKMFCVTSIDPPHKISFKVNDSVFGELTTKSDIIPAPYLARYKWVQVQEWDTLNDQEWDRLIAESYSLVKSKLPKSILKNLNH